MRPVKSILDPTFKYTNAASTNLHEKFKQVRRELAKQAQAAAPKANVVTIKKAVK